MSNQSSTSDDEQLTIQDIIHEIEEKSADGDYIFRGERQNIDRKVSSTLYRDFDDIDMRGFDIEIVQKEMLNGAKKHTGHLPHTGDIPQDFRPILARMFSVKEEDTAEVDFEILTEIQHYGGKTNLIDFTTDYLVALFFACDGHHDKDGRLILQKTDEIKDMLRYPRNPRHRVAGQKSVFVRSPKGYIEPNKDNIVIRHYNGLIRASGKPRRGEVPSSRIERWCRAIGRGNPAPTDPNETEKHLTIKSI